MKKSDVHSFEVVLIELLTEKKVVEFNGSEPRTLAMEFVSWILEILDRRVMNEK